MSERALCAAVETGQTSHRYIYQRVVDALLREDVRDCLHAAVIDGQRLAFRAALAPALLNGSWLYVEHLDDLYIPVEASDYMQPWRLRAGPLIRFRHGRVTRLETIEAVLACFGHGAGAALKQALAAFAEECRTAASHAEACTLAQQRYFAQQRAAGEAALTDWHECLLHYERLAAFLDHPYYPTARAKLGFSLADLSAFAPEFGAHFRLRWLAVPKRLYRSMAAALPDWWPSFGQVGLARTLRSEFTLLPVHPFTWDQHLDGLLRDAGLASQVIRAPRPYLAVTATLSVRTLAVCRDPQWHLKLPLSIRTLGARNIRNIKPSTIHDGQVMQRILGVIAADSGEIGQRLLLSDESRGAAVAEQDFLGFILRRYPSAVTQASVVPVAALLAQTPRGGCVFASLARQFYGGDLQAFFAAYVELTLRLHLGLWLRYGVALESNQQNSLLVLSRRAPRLRLLLKDNDAGRIHAGQLGSRCPALRQLIDSLRDRRILVEAPLALAQMFTTITLQLNIATLVEGLATEGRLERAALYRFVRAQIATLLDEFEAQGESVRLARQLLLKERRLPLKYLLRAASLEDKNSTGVTDVNKFYGQSAPNFLHIGSARS